MNNYQEAILKIKKMNCNITKDWNCEICTHTKVCAYYLPCKTLQELVDKETPKKLLMFSFSKEKHCPRCQCGNGEYEGTVGSHNYCHYCGQRLDWS